SYDTAGRLAGITLPRGAYTYSYDSASRVVGVSAPSNLTLSYGYDGAMITTTNLTGAVGGNISRAYDSDFRLSSVSVNGRDRVRFTYDRDGLLATAGDLTISRSSENGLLTGTSLGVVTDAPTYNSFGEESAYSLATGGSERLHVDYMHDSLGRISSKVET